MANHRRAVVLSVALCLATVTAATTLGAQGPDTAKHAAIGAAGIDVDGMDRSVAPGQDFYRYINGAWADRVAKNPDDPAAGRFLAFKDVTNTRLRAILVELAGRTDAHSDEGKLGIAFASLTDQTTIERLGGAPLTPYLDKLAAIEDSHALSSALGHLLRRGIQGPFGVTIQQDLKYPDRTMISVEQAGLGLPNRDLYLSDDAQGVAARAAYREQVATLFRLAKWPDPAAGAERVLAFERTLARSHWGEADTRDVGKIYNPAPVAGLSSSRPGLDWSAFLQAAGVANAHDINLWEPSAITAASAMVRDVPVKTWRDYLAARTILDAAPYLSRDFRDAARRIRDALYGPSMEPEPVERATTLVDGMLGDALGKVYVARYFPPTAKARIDELVDHLIAAMDARLAHSAWMSPETRSLARSKLARTIRKIGYPDRWTDYAGLRIERGDALGNALRARTLRWNMLLDRLSHPVDRTRWAMTPQMVNAYASAPYNDIVFPAAILQPPYFDSNADPAVNYGAIGAIIGHELTHNFDDRGSGFAPDGSLRVWWTPQDIERFHGLADRMVAQYSAYEPLPGTFVNGRLTLSENIADVGGLAIAFDAYHASLGGKPAPVIDGLSGDQRFFAAFGQLSRGVTTPGILRAELASNPHTPRAWRIYAVRNVPGWYDAFAIKPTDRYYLAPADRIQIW